MLSSITQIVPELKTTHEAIFGFEVAVKIGKNGRFITIDNRFNLKITSSGNIMCTQIAKYDLKKRKVKPLARHRTVFIIPNPNRIKAISGLMILLYKQPGDLQIAKANSVKAMHQEEIDEKTAPIAVAIVMPTTQLVAEVMAAQPSVQQNIEFLETKVYDGCLKNKDDKPKIFFKFITNKDWFNRGCSVIM